MLVRNVDVAVIGGGIAGLVAANDLARAGKSVVVFEKSSQLGGRAITIRKKGALFNLGGHALYRGGAADRIFRELGLRLEGGSPPRMVSVLWKNRVMPLPRFLFGRDMSWKGRMELLRVLAKLDRIDADAGEMNAMSVREWVERELRDPTVRSVFYALFRTGTFTLAPDLVTVGPALRQVRRAFRKRGPAGSGRRAHDAEGLERSGKTDHGGLPGSLSAAASGAKPQHRVGHRSAGVFHQPDQTDAIAHRGRFFGHPSDQIQRRQRRRGSRSETG
jgi:protoporphyrinogen oxidase